MPNRSVNKQILLGNMGADPEVRYTANGTCVVNFSVATSHKDHKSEVVTTWHKVVVWGKMAEIIGEYASKGTKVYVEGRTQSRKWEGRDGETRYTHEVNVGPYDTIKMLGGGNGSKSNVHSQQQNDPPVPQGPSPAFDDDVPF